MSATLLARRRAAAVVLDEDRVAVLGEGAKRFPVQATIYGYSWRKTVTRMHGEFLLGAEQSSSATSPALAQVVRYGRSTQVCCQ